MFGAPRNADAVCFALRPLHAVTHRAVEGRGDGIVKVALCRYVSFVALQRAADSAPPTRLCSNASESSQRCSLVAADTKTPLQRDAAWLLQSLPQRALWLPGQHNGRR